MLAKNNELAELALEVPLDFVVNIGWDNVPLLWQNQRRRTPFRKGVIPPSEFDYDFQPGSFATDLKTLFVLFKANGVAYGLNEFENDGTFLLKLYDQHWKKVA